MAEVGFNKHHPLYQADLLRILQTPGVSRLCGHRVLLSGSTGLLGCCLIDALMSYNRQGADITVYAMGRNRDKAAARLGEYFADSHFHFLEHDACEPLADVPDVDYIIPLASNTHPLAYSQYPVETIRINVRGAEYALRKAVACGATVLYPSSVEVYGNARGDDMFSEYYTGQLSLASARSCYPESKRVSEALCQSYKVEFGASVRIVRLSRVFGPTMLMSDSKASSQFLLKALNGEDIVLKSKGEQQFSYTYMADAVAAMLYVLLHGKDGEPYNVACPACNVRLKDFAALCAEWAGRQVVYDLPSDAEQRGFSIATRALLDNSRLTALGWRPQYTMRDAVARTLSILKQE